MDEATNQRHKSPDKATGSPGEPSAAGASESSCDWGKSRLRRISPWKRRLFAVLTLVFSTVLTYYFGEAIYRLSKYKELLAINIFPDVVTESPLDKFDAKTGFGYIPNTQTRYLDWGHFPGEDIKPQVENFLRINNMGHISWHDDRVEKPDGEFRIATLGDSFTAALEMSKPWPDMLEEILNHDVELKKALGASTFNVINFARDGIGIVQCAAIHKQEASKYNADLVILNFIDDDILRRLEYRATVQRDLGDFRYHVTVHTYSLPCSFENQQSFPGTVSLDKSDFESADKWKRVRKDLARLQLKRTQWFSPYPELLASRIGYPRLFSSYLYGHYSENEFDPALQACRDIKNTSRDALFLHIPNTYDQMIEVPQPVKEMIAMCPDLDITLMSSYLIEVAGLRDANRWFIPNDGHFNDYGGSVYARAVHRKLRAHFKLPRSK